jgi:hydroxypyruvate reductase
MAQAEPLRHTAVRIRGTGATWLAIDDAAARHLLRALFDAAVAAADPRVTLPPLLPAPPKGRTVVVGAGKSAALMAQVVEAHFPAPVGGLVVTRYGHAVPTQQIEVVEASHPVPDEAGEEAARRILAQVAGLTPDDLVLALMSGGGSALLSLPAPGLTLADKQAVNRALLASGASISEMNAVRKHLSAIKGGRLAAAAHPARVVTLAISDVPGDSFSVIASGPTVADESSFADARAIIARRGVHVPQAVARHLEAAEDETPKPGDPRLARAQAHLFARPQASLEAAAKVAQGAGITPILLGDAIEGEAREVATALAGIARSARAHGHPAPPPCVLLSGGETTVTVTGHAGKGGRNTEFLLGLAVALGGAQNIWAIAGDTDGIDGTEDAAGAIITPDTLSRGAAHDPRGKLAGHDSYSLFAALGDLVVTGPTLTNVNDFRAILVA